MDAIPGTLMDEQPDQQRASILIVDDRPDKHVVIRAILEDLGQNLVSVSSGEQALRQVLQREFAVILLDVNMPGLDGLETAALIRSRKQSAHVPIIFITADYGDEVRTAKAYSLGAVDFMASPVIPEILRSKVKVFVDLYLLAEQSRRQADERVALAEERAARAAAERANQRSAFLARASNALSGSLNYQATMRELARLAVPFLADVGAITLPEGEGVDGRTVVTWTERLPEQSLGMETWPTVKSDWWREAIDRVMASGTAESFAAGNLPDAVNGPGRSAAMRELELPSRITIDSLMILPLIARGRAVGAASLGWGSSGRTFDPDVLELATDLADRAAIALDNALLYQELHDQDRRKNEFLAMLSHELRNPLAPIANAVHVLQVSHDDPAKLTWAQEVLSRQVKQMNRLVDDLLDVSRITQGKIELKMDSVDVADVIAVAVETARPFIDAQEHELSVKLPSYPVRVKGDFSRLAQILANLFNNAAKYTDRKGRIELEVAEDGAEIVFRVRDSGIGIPAEAQATIFDLFKQLGNTVDRSQGGLGIGLTLVKRLVEMHGGTIKAKSEGPGMGSEFIVRLPLLSSDAQTDRGADIQPKTDQAAGSRKRHRILVADDNVDLATSMGLLLEMMGNEVRVTNDGMSAVDAESEFRPNIVFLDIGMAKLNGYDTCRRIRGKQWGSTPIIVALTGWGQAEDKRRSREAGFDHHLVKPIEPAALEQFLAELEPQDA